MRAAAKPAKPSPSSHQITRVLRRGIKSFKTAWKAALRRAGIADFRWHDLRHTVGTRLVQRGGDISVVQDFLGHSDIATTRRYVHHDTAAKRGAMELLSRNPPELPVRKSPNPLTVNK